MIENGLPFDPPIVGGAMAQEILWCLFRCLAKNGGSSVVLWP